MDIIKKKKEKYDISYQNDFIDDVIFNFDKRILITFFYLIHKFQQNSNSIEVSIEELKKILDKNVRSEEYIKELVSKLYDATIYYKSTETIVEDEHVKINKNDYVKDHLFDVLIFSKDGIKLKFVIKKRYQEYFLNLRENFTTTAIEILKNLNSTEILIYLQLNRWKNYIGDVEMNWEYFRLNIGFSKGYKNNDVLRRLDKALEKIKEETGLDVNYEIIRSKNKREILKIIFKINEHLKSMKLMAKSANSFEREIAKMRLKQLERNKWQEEEEEE